MRAEPASTSALMSASNEAMSLAAWAAFSMSALTSVESAVLPASQSASTAPGIRKQYSEGQEGDRTSEGGELASTSASRVLQQVHRVSSTGECV